MKKFYIGTNNVRKIESARKVLTEVLGTDGFTISGKDVPSGVGETPHDEDTMLGAQNRAQALIQLDDCEFGIGLESGLVERYGHIYEEAWCCVSGAEKTTYGYSSGLTVPDLITRRMKNEGLEHFEVLRDIKLLLPEKGEKDTWGNYSALRLTRALSFEEALRNALVQMFAPSESLYHL